MSTGNLYDDYQPISIHGSGRIGLTDGACSGLPQKESIKEIGSKVYINDVLIPGFSNLSYTIETDYIRHSGTLSNITGTIALKVYGEHPIYSLFSDWDPLRPPKFRIDLYIQGEDDLSTMTFHDVLIKGESFNVYKGVNSYLPSIINITWSAERISPLTRVLNKDIHTDES